MTEENLKGKRPLGVIILAILAFIGSIVNFASGGLWVFLGVLMLAMAYGLWNLKQWGWYLAMIGWIGNLIGGILYGGLYAIISFIVCVIVLGYIWTVRGYFGIHTETQR